MANSNVCWGIEIGSGAVKALKLARDGDAYKALEFIVIPHPRPLSSPDIDPTDAKRVALGALVSQHNLTKARVAVSVPGNAAFARFAKLPPVEPKKVPDIVKFEAVQQIPFPIEEVEWDYQTFVSADSPDVEVGIFAITREKVMGLLALCADVGIQPMAINISPVSAYNAIAFDENFTASTPGTAIVDIGTMSTDLIIAEAGRVWIRTFPMGGHAFTEALVSSFKLPYPKAEKLKLQAERSKHKRHVFQAMRSTFADFSQEVQRSLSYYEQLHPEADIKRIIGLGSTWKLLGLRKYIAQQLGVEVTRLSHFNQAHAEGASESDFNSIAINMATCYGLALQGLGQQTINANLMPLQVTRAAVWKQKTPWFAAAAAVALAAGGASFIGPMLAQSEADGASRKPGVRVVQDVKRLSDQLKDEAKIIAGESTIGATVLNVERLLKPRDVIPTLVTDIGAMLASADPQRELLSGDAGSIPPERWRLFEVKDLSIRYFSPEGGSPTGMETSAMPRGGADRDSRERGGGGGGGILGNARKGGGSARAPRRDDPEEASVEQPFGMFDIRMVIESPNGERLAFLDRTVIRWLEDNADRQGFAYRIIPPTDAEIVMETIQPTGVPGARPPGTTAGASRTENTATRDRGERSQQGGSTTVDLESMNLEAIAPLTLDPPKAHPITYRYTLSWRAILLDPARPAPGPDGEPVASIGGGADR